jgi:hypothetical protein
VGAAAQHAAAERGEPAAHGGGASCGLEPAAARRGDPPGAAAAGATPRWVKPPWGFKDPL